MKRSCERTFPVSLCSLFPLEAHAERELVAALEGALPPPAGFGPVGRVPASCQVLGGPGLEHVHSLLGGETGELLAVVVLELEVVPLRGAAGPEEAGVGVVRAGGVGALGLLVAEIGRLVHHKRGGAHI